MLFNAWAEILEQARREKGLTRERAAQKAGVATITWYRWETGLACPGPQQLQAIAEALGMPADEVGLRYARCMFDHYRNRVAVSGPEPSATPDPGPVAASRSRREWSDRRDEMMDKLDEILDAVGQRSVTPSTARPRRRRLPTPRTIRRRR